MGLFDSLKDQAMNQAGSALGPGAQGDQTLGVFVQALEKMGGLQGLVQRFQSQGLGHIVSSWVGTGENLPISPEEVQQGVGQDTVSQLAQQSGMGLGALLQKISQYLPLLVNQLTPNGQVPSGLSRDQLISAGLGLFKARQ